MPSPPSLMSQWMQGAIQFMHHIDQSPCSELHNLNHCVVAWLKLIIVSELSDCKLYYAIFCHSKARQSRLVQFHGDAYILYSWRGIVWLSYSAQYDNNCNANCCRVNVTTVRESTPPFLLLSSSYWKAAEIGHDFLWFDYPRVGCLTQVTKKSICWFDSSWFRILNDLIWVAHFWVSCNLFEKRKQIIESKVIHNAYISK